MKRLYGDEAASLITYPALDNPSNSYVSVKMTLLPGRTLGSIKKDKDFPLVEHIMNKLRQSNNNPVDELTEMLAKNGIVHDDINMENILYDNGKDKFFVIDFDRARLKDKGVRVNLGQENDMRKKFAQQFSALGRS